MKPTKIQCSACQGSGRVNLSPELSRVFALFSRKTRLTAQQVFDDLSEDVKPEAINNRLESLRRLGFLERKREGLAFRYFLPPPVKK